MQSPAGRAHSFMDVLLGISFPAVFVLWGLLAIVARWAWIPPVPLKPQLTEGPHFQNVGFGATIEGWVAVACGIMSLGVGIVVFGEDYGDYFQDRRRLSIRLRYFGAAVLVAGLASCLAVPPPN